MKNRANLFTLLACAVTAFLIILARYALSGGSPLNRMGYGIFMSVAPALAALLLLRLTRLSLSWQRTVGVYVVLFVLTMVFLSYARTFPVPWATSTIAGAHYG